MRILQVCYKPPFPATDGGAMGMNSLTTGLLNRGHQVKVVSFHSKKHPCNIEAMPQDYLEKTGFETVFVDLDIKLFPAIEAMLCGESYHVKRFINQAMKDKLRDVLTRQEFDIVQMESIFLTPYVPLVRKYSNAKVVLRSPNVENKIWQRTYKATKNPFKRFYLKHLYLTLEHYERERINDYDAIFPVTATDAEYFIQNGCRRLCKPIAVGIDTPEILPDVLEEPNSIFHIGSMNWVPNEQGIRWFLKSCWKSVKAASPQVKAYFAGRNMPDWLLNTHKKDVFVVGEVDDSIRFMTSKQIMVVPLLSGSGIRIKIIEAMSIGKTVIATTIAAEGLMYENGKNIIIADTPQEFAIAVKRCLDDSSYAKEIGFQAAQLIATRYNTDEIAKEISAYYEQL
ncbi:MAG: glycosyltransferase family 4 protein [Candidatus Onthomorpha sp.]|nr:glycosyltransferase family 4 protein [Bacteroidales bacterium]MDD7485156.1 glycosyltransferase family 4 protein [Bacteroidales bacterium]MDY5698447.1 glycosyltransferase family 4 protein [Candidatus Onthomorpha sp.]